MSNLMQPGRELEYRYPLVDSPPQRGWLFAARPQAGALDIWVETEAGELLMLMPQGIRFLKPPQPAELAAAQTVQS